MKGSRFRKTGFLRSRVDIRLQNRIDYTWGTK